MTFGEKTKEARVRLKLSQQALADQIGVSRQVINRYEKDVFKPRGLEAYKRLAAALQVNVNHLLTEEDEFVAEAHDKYGNRGAKQAEELVHQMGALFAGGELSASEKDAVMRAMQEIYWDAKEENKKYTPKKFLTTHEE